MWILKAVKWAFTPDDYFWSGFFTVLEISMVALFAYLLVQYFIATILCTIAVLLLFLLFK